MGIHALIFSSVTGGFRGWLLYTGDFLIVISVQLLLSFIAFPFKLLCNILNFKKSLSMSVINTLLAYILVI